MKKPYFNKEERWHMRHQTLAGSFLNIALAREILIKNIRRDHGWIWMVIARIMLPEPKNPDINQGF